MLEHYSQEHTNYLLLTPGQECDPEKQPVGVMDLNIDKSSMGKKNNKKKTINNTLLSLQEPGKIFPLLCHLFQKPDKPGNISPLLCHLFQKPDKAGKIFPLLCHLFLKSRSLAVISHSCFITVQRGSFLNMAQRTEDVHQVQHATPVHVFPQSLPRQDWETACFDTEHGKSSVKPCLCRDPAVGWTDVP